MVLSAFFMYNKNVAVKAEALLPLQSGDVAKRP